MSMKEFAKKTAKKAAKKVVQKTVTEPAKKAVRSTIKEPAKKAATRVSRGVATQVVKSTVAGAGPCGGCGKPFDGRAHNKPACSRAAARPMVRIHELP